MEPELSSILTSTLINPSDGQVQEKETSQNLTELIDFLKDKMSPSVSLND